MDKRIEALGYQGTPIECSKEEYSVIRSELQRAAGQWIDQGQVVRAIIALDEVKRLDDLFTWRII
jgi:hypothetical protein